MCTSFLMKIVTFYILKVVFYLLAFTTNITSEQCISLISVL